MSAVLIHARSCPGWSGTVMEVEPERAEFDYLKFQVHRLTRESYSGTTDPNELGIAALEGGFSLSSSQGSWDSVAGQCKRIQWNVPGRLPFD